jgi:hypothetical protein
MMSSERLLIQPIEMKISPWKIGASFILYFSSQAPNGLGKREKFNYDKIKFD